MYSVVLLVYVYDAGSLLPVKKPIFFFIETDL
jgi:hypothetical protein